MEPDYGLKGFKSFFINVVAVEIAKHYFDEDEDGFEEGVDELIREVFSHKTYIPFIRVMDEINAGSADFTADFDSPDFSEKFEDIICQVMISGGRDEIFLEGREERLIWASLEVQRLLVEAYMLLSDLEEDEGELDYRGLLSLPKYQGRPFVDK